MYECIYVAGSNCRVYRNAHTRWCGKQASSLALSRAPVCGSEKLPEGRRRDTGGGLRDDIHMYICMYLYITSLVSSTRSFLPERSSLSRAAAVHVCKHTYMYVCMNECMNVHTLQGVTAASSGTHTHTLVRKAGV